MHRYKCWNAAMPTTAPMAAVATGTATKTMLQIAATRQFTLVSWGYTLSGVGGAVGTVELISTDVAATGLTAHAASGVQPLDPNTDASAMALGAGATGFAGASTTEGTPTVVRVFDTDQIPTASGLAPINYDYQWMPDERPTMKTGHYLRIRATFPTSGVNMLCWACWDE